MRDNKFSKKVHILNGRCYEQDCDKDYGVNFPFDIERLPSDSDDYYKGYCKGMEMLFELVKRGDLVDKGIIYDEDFEDECGECEDCTCFNSAFDMGFRQGSKIAREELMDDIYIDGYRISKIDDIKHKVIALGSDNSEKVNEILKDLTDLIKDFAMDAVDEYLGYR